MCREKKKKKGKMQNAKRAFHLDPNTHLKYKKLEITHEINIDI